MGLPTFNATSSMVMFDDIHNIGHGVAEPDVVVVVGVVRVVVVMVSRPW